MKKLLLLPLALASCTVTQQDTQPKYVEPVYSPKRTRDDFKDITTISYIIDLTEPKEISNRSGSRCSVTNFKHIGAFRLFTKSKPVNYLYSSYDFKYPYLTDMFDFFSDEAELIFIFDGIAQKAITTTQLKETTNTLGSCQIVNSSKVYINQIASAYFDISSLNLNKFKDADNVQYAIYSKGRQIDSITLSKRSRDLLYATWHETEY